MQNYNYNAIVSRNEAEALKEMIFNRIRQRAEAMAKDAQNNYTTSFKEEIMDIARSSVEVQRNPFNTQIKEQKTNNVHSSEQKQEVGFKQKVSENNIKEIIRQKNEIVRENAAQNEIAGVMNKAGEEFGNSKNFVGALKFLNAQAGVNMANKHKTSFEAIA